MKIAVLGCGPAGLMAAHGAIESALRVGDMTGEITIFSRKAKSPMYGAQYLHRPIPGIEIPEPNGRSIEYRMIGETSDYRRKVYGQGWLGAVSPEDLEGLHTGWDIRATYDQLWYQYSDAIIDVDLDPVGLSEMLDGSEYDIVINSVPRDRLCYRDHTFAAAEIKAAGDAPDLGIDIGSTYRCMDETVMCNGTPDVGWYRMSRIYGHTTVEWPSSIERIPITSASTVMKPTYTDCDCWPTFVNVGRYGTWEKGVLSHDAYFKAYESVAKMEGVR